MLNKLQIKEAVCLKIIIIAKFGQNTCSYSKIGTVLATNDNCAKKYNTYNSINFRRECARWICTTSSMYGRNFPPEVRHGRRGFCIGE